MEVPDEGEGNTRRASGDPGLSQLTTSHKPIKPRILSHVFFPPSLNFLHSPVLGAVLADREQPITTKTDRKGWRVSTSTLELTV